MSRIELLNSGNLRLDGRKPDELRSLEFHISPDQPSYTISELESNQCDGSSRVQQGLTSVYSKVFGPKESRNRSLTSHDKAVIQIDINFHPWSSNERRKRVKNDRKISEISNSIQKTFESIVQLHLYPRSLIEIFVLIEQQDGSLLSCIINSISLALIDSGISMIDYCCSLMIGLNLKDEKILLDLTFQEENSLPNLVLAILPRSKSITFLQLESRIHSEAIEKMISKGIDACQVLFEEIDFVMNQRTKKLINAMGDDSNNGLNKEEDQFVSNTNNADVDYSMDDY